MSWQLYITQTAEQDINNAVDYIDFVLKNPQAADALLDETERQLTGLLTFPEKFPLVNDPVLASKGVRFTLIKNHLAFYIISKETHTILIVRFLYGKSNWVFILKGGFSLT